MTTREPKPPPNPHEKPSSGAAKDRLAAALRENLKRRKAQERARSDREDHDQRARDAKTESPPPKPEEDR